MEINNQPGVDTIPGWAMDLKEGGNIWYDWWHYGGIVRDVWLAVSDATLIRRQFIRTKVDGKAANITNLVYLENYSHRPLDAKMILKAWSPEGGSTPAATAQQNVKLTPGKQDFALTLKIDSAKLWDFDHPNVYLMEVDLVDAKGNTLDSITDNFGVRTVELRDSKLWLNGEAVRLSGMARHEESPWEGLAETRGTILHDWDDMKNLEMTLARPVHYPQHPLILDYADRHGIMLIPEIPIWHFTGEQLESAKVETLARQMMQEMIEQAGNHPSIWAWSTCNESSTDTPGGRAYFKMMYDFIKSLDPDRYVSYADDRIAFTDNPRDNSAGQADFIMWNEYFGAWHGPTSMLPAVFERIRKGYPGKMVIVSEFGTPGLFAPNSEEGDKLRARIYREQMAMFGKQDWISGALMWCYQDYKSHRNLWPGYTAGYVDHGVVDENRQRRPSYAVWRELNAPARVELAWTFPSTRMAAPLGFKATIARRARDEIPSYELRGYRFRWELRDDKGVKIGGGDKVLPDIGPPQTIEITWQAPTTKSLKLSLWLDRPNGFSAYDKIIDWWESRPGGLDVDDMKKAGMNVPN